tara:strand:+ start:2833 stop:3243 length:411 start_codon:yes stop_codon:yes gene_type:complete
MRPTFKDKELLVVQRINTVKDWKPRRYDMVIVRTEWYEKLSKRVIGLEGERVKIKYGKIFINDKEHKDPYGKGDITFWVESEEERATKPKEEWLFFNVDQDIGIIPKGHVFVMGDNRTITWYGKVKIKNITDLIIF